MCGKVTNLLQPPFIRLTDAHPAGHYFTKTPLPKTIYPAMLFSGLKMRT